MVLTRAACLSMGRNDFRYTEIYECEVCIAAASERGTIENNFFFFLWDFSLPFRFVIIIVLPRRVGWSTVENLLLFVAFLVRWDTDILLKDSKRKVSNKLDGWKVTEGWWKLKLFGVALIKEKKGAKKCYRTWTKSRNEYYRIFRQSI